MVYAQVAELSDSERPTLLKTIGSSRGGGIRLACGLGFDVVLGGLPENRGRWGDLWFGGLQDRVMVPRPPGGQGCAGGGPVQVVAGHQVLALKRYDADLDAAFERARVQADLTPLVQTVRRWWFEADAWRDPQAQREFLARVDTYRNEGLPPSGQRTTREEVRARFGV